MTDKDISNQRRSFLIQAAGLTAAGSLLKTNTSAGAATPAATVPDSAADAASPPYQSLSPDEATFIEALVNVMCPADEYSPNGVDCGIATYIDRQLAGPYGKGDGRYLQAPFRSGKPELGLQLPLTPEQFCKAGIAAANAACVSEHGKPFAELDPAQAGEFLKAVAAGRVPAGEPPLALWFDTVIYRLFVEGLLRRSHVRRQSQCGVLEDDRLPGPAGNSYTRHGEIPWQAVSRGQGPEVDRRLHLMASHRRTAF